MPSKEAVTSAVTTYVDGIAALDAAKVASTFAPDGVAHEAVGEPLNGPEAVAAFFGGLFAGVESMTFRSNAVYTVGDEVAFTWSGHVVAKSGSAVDIAGVDVFVVGEDGKVKTMHGYWDPTALLSALHG